MPPGLRYPAKLGNLSDIPSTDDDLAIMAYEWDLAGTAGRWVDAAYRRVLPDAVDRLEEILLLLEEAAG
jgi:hypothetical protein